MSQPSMLQIAFKVAETRARVGDDPYANAVLDAAGKWLDDWDAFNALPWYRQLWRTFRGEIPTYDRPPKP